MLAARSAEDLEAAASDFEILTATLAAEREAAKDALEILTATLCAEREAATDTEETLAALCAEALEALDALAAEAFEALTALATEAALAELYGVVEVERVDELVDETGPRYKSKRLGPPQYSPELELVPPHM